MKRTTVTMLVLAIFAALVPNPAAAAERTSVSRERARGLCLQLFSEDRCDAVASDWHDFVTQSTPTISVREMSLKIVGGAARKGDVVCEDIFSDQVCALIGRVFHSVEEPGETILGLAGAVLTLVREQGDEIVGQVLCLLDPNRCPLPGAPRSSEGGDPCREVFSDAVCDRIEEGPGPILADVLELVWETVSCYLDPACMPITIHCGELLCDRAQRRQYAF